MTLEEKLEILSDAAKYDASCASSGSRRHGKRTGNTSVSGICHSWSSDGRCISLLKILLSNVCRYDCAYCVNRARNDVARATFDAEEVIRLTIEFYKRNYIEGLFLSSAVFASPDRVMETMVTIARQLRQREGFGGYIHLKAIPGASLELTEQAGLYADRISVNIELPSEQSLNRLAPQKNKASIIAPMRHLGEQITARHADRRRSRKAPAFAPGGQSTQMIVGASPETDRDIVHLGEALYRKFALKRIYYSAYVPVNLSDRDLPEIAMPPLLREHRLYQADWLIRNYGFEARELLDQKQPNLNEMLDPKTDWAIRNFHHFPIDVNTADYEWLLRIPGIGVTSAKKILSARRFHRLNELHLQKIGIVMKRARFFIQSSQASHLYLASLDPARIKSALQMQSKGRSHGNQLEFNF